MSASDVSPFHLRFARFTQLSGTCRCPLLGVWFAFCCFPLFGLFCKCQRCLTSFFNYTALDDRQCFHALGFAIKKKLQSIPSCQGAKDHTHLARPSEGHSSSGIRFFLLSPSLFFRKTPELLSTRHRSTQSKLMNHVVLIVETARFSVESCPNAICSCSHSTKAPMSLPAREKSEPPLHHE